MCVCMWLYLMFDALRHENSELFIYLFIYLFIIVCVCVLRDDENTPQFDLCVCMRGGEGRKGGAAGGREGSRKHEKV